MKKIITIVLAIAAMTVSSCRIESVKKKGELKTCDIAVKDFRNIHVAGGYDVKFIQGDSISVRVEAPEELLDQVSIESDGTTLMIKSRNDIEHYQPIFIKGGSIGKSEPVTIYVSAPDLDEITVTGPADFSVPGSLTADKLKVTLTGSGDIDLRRVRCQSAELWLTGSGDIEMRPIWAETIKASIVGSGDIELHAKDVRMVEALVSGSGDMKVACANCDKATAKVTGSGDIEFTGQINEVMQSVTGSGSIEVDKNADVAFLFEDNDSTLTE